MELNPGYPGYRGFVSGLAGPGEVACLEQLKREYPWFDRDREDQENAAAAVRLGLAGGPKDWVWENWLAIEGERGLPITCYTCAQEKIAAGEPYEAAPVGPNDVRLLVGTFGSNELLFRVAARNRVEMWVMDSFGSTDYQLRAMAWTAYRGYHVNAWQLDSAYDTLVDWITGQYQAPQAFLIALTQGGYAPTPPQAAFEDQIFLLATALEAQASSMSDVMANARRRQFDALVRQWASERGGGSTQGLGEFLCPIYAAAYHGEALECIKPSTQ